MSSSRAGSCSRAAPPISCATRASPARTSAARAHHANTVTEPLGDRSFIPEGWHTVTPRIVVHGAAGFVEFCKRVLGATGEVQEARPSIVTVGDSIVMVSEAGARPAATAFLYVYVSDADATYRRAVEAGARTLEEPLDTPYGDRRCMVEDAWGNTWQIATHAARHGPD